MVHCYQFLICTLHCILVICLNFDYGQSQPNALITATINPITPSVSYQIPLIKY